MVRFLNVMMLLVLAGGLTACSSGETIFNKNPQLVAAPDKVSMMLADAASRASTAMETLAAVEQARTPDISVEPIGNAPAQLRRAITVNWVGPVEPIVVKLASRAGYKFQTVGTQPPVPIVVSIDVENKPVIEVLRSIGLQMGHRADIRVDGKSGMVEVHYAPKGNGGLGG